MFSLICAWINGWVDNREAGDWRRHRAHYDVIVMFLFLKVDIGNANHVRGTAPIVVQLQIYHCLTAASLYDGRPSIWKDGFYIETEYMDQYKVSPINSPEPTAPTIHAGLCPCLRNHPLPVLNVYPRDAHYDNVHWILYIRGHIVLEDHLRKGLWAHSSNNENPLCFNFLILMIQSRHHLPHVTTA